MNDLPPVREKSVVTASARSLARERVRAMEALAGIVAHEIRSSVLGVTSAAQLLRYSLPTDPAVEKSLGRILQESERLNALHEALTEYSTEVPPRLVDGDPDALWNRVIAGMRGPLEANSVVVTHQSADAAIVAMDDTQVTRAFERLVHQAIARGRPGCELHIESTTDDHDWHSRISVTRLGATATRVEVAQERPSFIVA